MEVKFPAIENRFVSIWTTASLKTKILFAFLVLIAIPMFISNYIQFSTFKQQLETLVVDDGFADVQGHSRVIQSTIDVYSRAIAPLGGSASIKGYHLAIDNGGKDPITNQTAAEWKKLIADSFLESAKLDDAFTQLRYIDILGNEVVRVDSENGIPHVVKESQLQNKSNRYYFQETNKLKVGDIYISKLDLNREGDPPDIQEPFVPTLRFSTPVIKLDGTRRGMVVMNIHRDKIFETVRNQNGVFSKNLEVKFIADNNGYYLHHQDQTKTFGNSKDLDTGENVKKDYGLIANKILSGESAAFAYQDSLVAFAPVFPYGDENEDYWVLFESTPKSLALKSIEKLQSAAVSLSFVFLGLLSLGALGLARISETAINNLKKEIKETTTTIK